MRHVEVMKLSTEVWTHFIAAVAGGLFVSAIDAVRHRFSTWKLVFRNAFRPKPTVDLFAELIHNTGYHGVPDDRRPRYFVRQPSQRSEDQDPTYHFFVQPTVKIQRFLAFLIPPLDFGHGPHTADREHGQRLGLEFDKRWLHYLTGIGKQARNSFEAGSFRNRKFILFHEQLKFEAKRVVFVDKNLLRLFIFEHDWVIETAHLDGTMFAPGWDKSPLTSFARSVLLYAFDIARIHDIVWEFRDSISCHYVSKALVKSSQYYDFGCYWIDGVPIIYSPTYRKGDNKHMDDEKVLIGISGRQDRQIKAFTDDFDELWQNSRPYQPGINWREEFDEKYKIDNPRDVYYGAQSLSPEDFHRGYYAKVHKILDKLRVGE